MRVAIFAGSSSKSDELFYSEASVIGATLAKMGHHLVYGGGAIGLMGAAADAAISNDGKVIGVIPSFMVDEGWAHTGIDELIVTTDMSSRKSRIFELADAIISLPGGIGTLEELTEAMTLKQLGVYRGPIVILNSKGFYNKFIEFIDHMAEKRFFRPEHKSMFLLAETAEEAVNMAVQNASWIDNPRSLARI